MVASYYRRQYQRQLKVLLLSTLTAAVLAGCGKPVEKSVDIRPVRVLVAASSDVDVAATFSGEVRARVESRLGFRVGGKVIARKVDPGTLVHQGQVLMQLDPQDLQLSQAQALAALRSAETSRDLAKVELSRYQELRSKNFVSSAVLDAKQSTLTAAQANVDAAQAAYRAQSNQAAYTSLVADSDGVVTAVDAEVGQVLQAGTPVVRVARLGEREIVIGLPEDQVETLRRVQDVQIRLWAEPHKTVAGKIREIAPMADPATRTYTAKVSIPDAWLEAKLGMTAVVQFASKRATPQIKLPLTALYYEKAATSVWVVEAGVVKLVPVTIAGAAGNDIVIASGIKAGQTVVTAGVHLLKPGQKVKILGQELPTAATTPALAGGAR